ncbi:hypothetical protein ACHAXR_001837 [Thalassiosira sp. AJA248-18]
MDGPLVSAGRSVGRQPGSLQRPVLKLAHRTQLGKGLFPLVLQAHMGRHGVTHQQPRINWYGVPAEALIKELEDLLQKSDKSQGEGGEAAGLPRQRLLEIRGFLIYVARTYRWLNPYLKGLHNTIDGWRPDQNEGG